MKSDYLIAFAVNIGKLGRASSRPAMMDDWLHELNSCLRDNAVRFVDYFGHTGNFVIDGRKGCSHAKRQLSELLTTPCVVMSIGALEKCVAAIERLPSPPAEPGIRRTPGVLFLVTGTANKGSLEPVRRAVFHRISVRMVAAWKRDVVTAGGRLDRGYPHSGWGSLSHAVGRQLGGIWTARSLSTLRGVLDRALHPVGLRGPERPTAARKNTSPASFENANQSAPGP